MKKAHGGLKINPDEQRRYLGTFEERVLGYVDIDTANSPSVRKKGFLFILENLQEKAEPLFVKISPTIEFDKQVFYLKEAKETDSQATIVSEEHITSPFGLVIHSNAPVQVEEKTFDLLFQNFGKLKRKNQPKHPYGRNGLAKSCTYLISAQYWQPCAPDRDWHFFKLSSKGSLFSKIEKTAWIFSNGRGGKSSARLPQIAITGTPTGVLLQHL